MATSETTSVDRVFGALNEGSSVLLGAVRSANERAFRVQRRCLRRQIKAARQPWS